MRRRLAATGTNLRDLIAQERMSLARVLLADRHLAVADVALRCGYESPTKFARQFTRWVGQRPSQWRARLAPPGACAKG
jgi:AraC-like DNA-binding protein